MTSAVLRHSPRDGILVALAAMYGLLLLVVPSAPLIAVGLWWTANTVAHNFIHRRFFHSRWANVLFSLYLSLLIGVPQTLWRERHLAHHAGRPWRLRWSRALMIESIIVGLAWVGVAMANPHFFIATWVAGWAGGMMLCTLQGHFEHAGGTVSHYGRLYNVAFFNDGFHAEHHAHPGIHWRDLPRATAPAHRSSRWPAVLRWMEVTPLDALERIVLRSRLLQRFVVDRHTRAFRRVLAGRPVPGRITVIGGGLFPRTALVMRRLAPAATITIVDRSAENLERARGHLDEGVRIVEASYSGEPCDDADLVVLPLAFDGDRERIYEHPPAPAVAIHDWIWRRRGDGCVVSFLLLKRVNIIRR
jgi:hypothetical protein